MATNYKQPGKVITLAAPYDRTSGQGAQVGSLFGVALAAVLETVDGAFAVTGVWELAKTSAQAWTQGQKIYWDNSNKRCDSDPEIGMLIGVATEAAANPSSTGIVRLNGVAPATAEGPQDAIVALTDSTGGSGTHDDTLADGLNTTATAALTATALGDLVATQNTGWGASTEAGFDSISTKFDALLTDVTAIKAKVDSAISDLAIQNQNDSDLAQKVLEIRAALIAAGILAAS